MLGQRAPQLGHGLAGAPVGREPGMTELQRDPPHRFAHQHELVALDEREGDRDAHEAAIAAGRGAAASSGGSGADSVGIVTVTTVPPVSPWTIAVHPL